MAIPLDGELPLRSVSVPKLIAVSRRGVCPFQADATGSFARNALRLQHIVR